MDEEIDECIRKQNGGFKSGNGEVHQSAMALGTYSFCDQAIQCVPTAFLFCIQAILYEVGMRLGKCLFSSSPIWITMPGLGCNIEPREF